jgi:pimeloyl-ACP methyl ester carboxylesterase
MFIRLRIGYSEAMPVFTNDDGTDLVCRLLDGPGGPVVCLPGGPLRATSYMGNLGGLDQCRQLAMLELPRRRVDAEVGSVELLRGHLGLDKLDILAHSAGGNLAMLYAAAFPHRIRKLVLVTPGLRAVGMQPTDNEFAVSFDRRSSEAWYAESRRALDAVEAGDNSSANNLAAAAFQYGRWDEGAQRHAASAADETFVGAAEIFYAKGAFDVPATAAALARLNADVLIVVGERDFLPTVSGGQQLAKLFANATMVVQDGAGHYPWIDNGSEFVSIVSPFLA